MRLHDLINDHKTLIALPIEELAVLMLTHMNEQAKNDFSQRHRAVPMFHFVEYCGEEPKCYSQKHDVQAACMYALAVAWQHLVTTGMLARAPNQPDWWFLTPRARAIQSPKDFDAYRKASLYPHEAIHPSIAAATYQEFLRGAYEDAIFKAFKCVEVTVRKRARLANQVIGTTLMRKAFDPVDGRLTDPNEELPEREALAHLFAGAIGRFKNPSSHRVVDYDDPAAVLEALGLASLLVRIAEERGTGKVR